MSDIVKAIEKEKEYVSYRMKGQEPFHLVDAIKECGFESLEEYFEAKSIYEFSNLSFEVIETTPSKAIEDVMDVMAKRKTAVLFADTERTIVWNGNNSTFNERYCEECDIPIYPLQTGGGTIVSTVGDLNIGICVPQDLGNVQIVLNGLAKIFSKHTDMVVEVDGNDILVGGYKVVGSSTYNINGMFMFITPVSLSEKSELIRNICKKHSVKQHRHIDFMDNTTLRQEVAEWLRVQ
jgi:lipoate-protein ligase A